MTEEDDAGGSRKSGAEGQLAEVLVEHEQQTLLGTGSLQDLLVLQAGSARPDPQYVVPPGSERLDRLRGEVLVSEKPHQVLPNG